MQQTQKTRSFLFLSAVASVALFSAAQGTRAAITTWAPTVTTATGEASFNAAANWTNGVPTNASGSTGDTALFTGTPTIDGTPITTSRLPASAVAYRVNFDNSGGAAAAFTIAGSQLNLYNSVTVAAGVTTNQTFSNVVSLRVSTQTFTNNGGGLLAFSNISQNSSNTGSNPVSAVFTGVAGGNIRVGVINNSGGADGTGTTARVTKNGTNQLLLTGASTYSGTTTVNAGTLALNAGASINNPAATGLGNTSALMVNAGTSGATPTAGGTLAGSGTVARAVVLANTGNTATGFAEGASLSPGVAGVNGGVGTLTLSSTTALTLAADSNLNFDLTGTNTTAGGTNDRLVLTAAPTVSGVTRINVNAMAALANGTYTLASGYAGLIDGGSFANLSVVVTGDVAGTTYALQNNAGQLDLVVSVPEPASVSLVLGGIGLGLVRRRRGATPR